jgi:hypothetical protein
MSRTIASGATGLWRARRRDQRRRRECHCLHEFIVSSFSFGR